MAAVDLEISQFKQCPSRLSITGAFSLVVRPGGRALVYPGEFDGLVFFTFSTVLSLPFSGKFIGQER